MAVRVLVINEKDNVGVALEDIAAGSNVSLPGGSEFPAENDIPYSHKVAIRKINAGEGMIKYGETIGTAARDIEVGEWVHTHNMESSEEAK